MNTLSVLIGKKWNALTTVHDYCQIQFEDYVLNVYNSMIIQNRAAETRSLATVVSIQETGENIQITVGECVTIYIDMTEHAWA